MTSQTRIDQKRVVVQTGHSQLVLTSVDSPEATRLIVLPGSIETFTLNDKSDLLAVLVDKQWHCYRLSSGSKLETATRIEWRPFHVALLYEDALWLGQVKANPAGQCLFMFAQHLLENVHFECSAQLPNVYGTLELSKYAVSEDQLWCVFKCAMGSVVCNVRLSTRRIESSLARIFEEIQITLVVPRTDNALLLLLTEQNVVYVLDTQLNETVWRAKSQLKIKSLCFDCSYLWGLVCVCTDKHLFFLYHLPHDQQLVTLEALPNKSNLSLVTFRRSTLFSVVDNALSSSPCEQLNYLRSIQHDIEDMFTLGHKQFVKKLHSSDSEKTIFWSTMAKRCLQEKDLNSAVYCAAKMGEARLARDLRRQMATHGSLSAFALLALNLGLAEEAEEMLHDDTNALLEMLQLQNKWNDAFLHADKMQIKSVYYNYARQLEELNKTADAVKYYEQSGNVLEVPRMLFEAGNIGQLEEYCLKSAHDKTSSSLVTWWGQYCESQGDHKSAIEMYQSVDDYYNLVRLLCHVGQTEKAIHIVNEHLKANSSQMEKEMTAAILYLGKHLEALNSTESIHYYLQCGAVRHAIRVCINNELFDQLVSIAVDHCTAKEARHILDNYCTPNQVALNEENLAKLYFKCGLTEEAILLTIRNHAWDQLREICHSELAKETRNYLIADQVLEQAMLALKSDTNIIDIVIDLIIMSSSDNFGLITRTIRDYGINLDDHLMEKLERYIVNHQNAALVDTFAELCLEKGNYQLAAKLYNKIGKRVDSLKALIRWGNVDKVVQFANVCRDKLIFKMAANFLQTVNYEDSSLIVKFYTKAEAYQELDRYKSEMQSRSGGGTD